MTILRKKRCCCGKCREQKQSQQIKSYLEKTVDFNTECQYCTSETLEIAVEIEGVEDGSKEGVFVAEKSCANNDPINIRKRPKPSINFTLLFSKSTSHAEIN